MQCPKCHTPITAVPDPGGFMLCPGCGAKLMSRPARPRPSEPTPPAGTGAVSDSSPLPGLENLQLPETFAPSARKAQPGSDTTPSGGRSASRPAPEPERAPAPTSLAFEEILAEIRTLREMQEEILQLLRSGSETALSRAAPVVTAFQGFREEAPSPPAIRSRRRKTVLLIDDDPESRQTAMAAFEQAEIPARAVQSGGEGLLAIAEEKPDVIALELDLSGDMGGKDVINMIKATMEWVDIPIVLYTRVSVESQKEARTIHGADEVVLKQNGPPALVSRIIAVFRSR
jgi:CheY-like chemotaxis protein